jgi:hypothetical protein
MKAVACVLRSGGEYKPAHVTRLRDQVAKHLPGAGFWCLTDLAVPGVNIIPLQYGWPGWWAKMELFNPVLAVDWLYFDLDSTIVGSLAVLEAVRAPMIMRDVYRPSGWQSSVMAIPQAIKAPIWNAFTASPAKHMREFARGGDQAFLEAHGRGAGWRLWQDVCPGQLCSFKADVRRTGKAPAGTSVVVFHGKPRPWDVGW